MKKFMEFLKTTFIGGLVVITPIVLALFIIVQAVSLLLEVVRPLVQWLPVKTVGGITIATLIALGIVIGACFLAGLAVRSTGGAAVTGWIERNLLSKLPGYQMFRNIIHRVARIEGSTDMMPAVIHMTPEIRMLGFIVEEHENGDYTVFIPSTPALTVGHIQIVTKEKVQRLEAPIHQVANCLMEWGAGSRALFRPAQQVP